MRAKSSLEHTRDRGPRRAGADAGHAAQRDEQRRRKLRQRDADPRGRERGDVELTFGADVQQAAAQRDGNGEAGEDERRGEEQRIADAVRPREGASEQQAVGFDRTVADEEHDERADGKRAEHGDQREEQLAQLLHA